jgi:hypothetical protein
MQQACNSEGGESRRGGEKPRGRNGSRGWLPRTEARPAMVGREWTPAEHVDGGAGSQRCDQETREPWDRLGNRSVRRTHLETRMARPARCFHRGQPSRATHGDSNREVRRGSRRPVSTGSLRNRRHPSKTRTATCKVMEGAAKATELQRRLRRNHNPIQKMGLRPGPSPTRDSITSRAMCRQ